MTNNTIRLAIFDWAGTMIDHGSCAPAAAFIEGFARRNVTVTVEQARGPMGMGKWDHIKTMTEMPEIAAEWQRIHGRGTTDADIDDMYDDFVPVLMDVLPDYCTLISGATATVDALRTMGCKIGGTTGYFDAAMDLCAAKAAEQGYTPDSSIAATQVKAGRPAPWLIFETMARLDVYPVSAVVKIGDTRPDIDAGHNAGVWTIGVAASGNSVGLSEAELTALPQEEQAQRIQAARDVLQTSNPHYIVDSVADVPAIVAQINERLQNGERP